MSQNMKMIVWIVVAIAVVGVGWWLYTMNMNASAPASNGNGTSTPVTQSGAADNSDQAIGQSMANVDTQINGFTSDSAAVDQGLNDQPVPQQQF